MKKLIAFFVMSFFLIGSMTVVLTANQSPPDNASTICTQNGDFGLSHGECVSTLNHCFNGNGNTFANCVCDILNIQGQIGDDGLFKNYGQCVSTLKKVL